jgi:hypothetical protein
VPPAVPGPPDQGPGARTPPPGGDEPNDGFAVAALIFGVLGGLLAVVFGIVALLRIRRSGRPGKRLAIAGLVLAAIWIVGLGAALALRGPDDAERSGDGAIVAAGDLSAFSFREGDCWNDPPLDEVVKTVDAVPCTAPHDAEVYAVYDVDFDEFPGDDEIGAAAEAGCIERFAAFAGIDYASSTLEVVYLNPTKESWDTEDDRSAVCSVSDPAAPATGSLRNAAR